MDKFTISIFCGLVGAAAGIIAGWVFKTVDAPAWFAWVITNGLVIAALVIAVAHTRRETDR